MLSIQRRSRDYNDDKSDLGSIDTQSSRANKRLSFHDLALGVRKKIQLTTVFRKPSTIRGLTPPSLLLENTYRTHPQPDHSFRSGEVTRVITGSLREVLLCCEYEVALSGKLACLLSEKIKDEVKKLGMKRYKLVCHVIICANTGQGSCMTSRCLLNKETDNYAEGEFVSDRLIATAAVFGMYCE